MKNIAIIALLAFLFSSCNDFLQREPKDFGSEVAYFNSAGDLEAYANGLYSLFPTMKVNWGGLYAEDINSDNQTSSTQNTLFYKGGKTVPDIGNSQWKFENIRSANYFLDVVKRKQETNGISGAPENINHYIGEILFFRAYDYYRLLTNYGDVPILTEVLPNDYEAVVKASKRIPRNEVARFMLKDLDEAARLMYSKAPKNGRLSRDAALLMKARVALFEATFLKYHKRTAFVPGNAKWVGHSIHPNYQFPAGSIDAEIDFFLQQAIDASEAVLTSRPELHNPYREVFNRTSGVENINEVILARSYLKSVSTHSATNFLKNTGAGCGLTKSLVESFLMTDGKPCYQSLDYKGDKLITDVLTNRDARLVASLKKTGYWEENPDDPTKPKAIRPTIGTGNQNSSTGYDLYKFVSDEPGQDKNQDCTTALPIFRSAEAMLIYIESYYEKHGALGGNCDLYWRKLRTRAGVQPDYTLSENVDFDREEDLAKYSRGVLVSKVLYNIRRERRCELIGEGMRLNDLKRWRALDMMTNYVVKGMNMWETGAMKQFYKPDEITSDIVSQAGDGFYVCPFLTSGSTIRAYNFPKAHYLEPIPVSEIIMTAPNGDVSRSPIYQNPAWPNRSSGQADYNADLD